MTAVAEHRDGFARVLGAGRGVTEPRFLSMAVVDLMMNFAYCEVEEETSGRWESRGGYDADGNWKAALFAEGFPVAARDGGQLYVRDGIAAQVAARTVTPLLEVFEEYGALPRSEPRAGFVAAIAQSVLP